MSVLAKFYTQTFPPAPKFTEDDVPDLAGKVMLITGGNSGIGEETARVLLLHNAKVYIACRPSPKTAAAVEELKRKTGKTDADLLVLPLDLSDLPTIKTAVEQYLQQESRLDVIFNNGGIMRPPIDQFSKTGIDLQFATNVLGHFYLTQLLLPLLIATAKTSLDGKARIVNVSGAGHELSACSKSGGPVKLDTLVDGPKRNKENITALFCQSKSGQVLHANALARKYGDQGIVATSLHPGMIRTPLWRGVPQKWLENKISADVDRGALTQLYAGTSPEGANFNGKYLIPWARIGTCREDHNDPIKQDEMWAWCEAQTAKVA